jgi:hypothetical protein
MPKRIQKWARRVYRKKDGYVPQEADYAAALILRILEKEGVTREVISQLSDGDIEQICNGLMEDGKPIEIGQLMAHAFVEELKNPSPPAPGEKEAMQLLKKFGFLEK